MAEEFNRPGFHYTEKAPRERTATGVSTGIGAFMGIASRGPVNKPIRITEFDQFRDAFGGPVFGESLYHAVKGFFDGGGKECVVVRLAHYGDVEDVSTMFGDAASLLLYGTSEDGPANLVGTTDATTLALPEESDYQIALSVDGGTEKVATFIGTRATIDGIGDFTASVPAGTSASYRVNNGPVRTIDISGETAPSADAAGYALLLSSKMVGVQVSDVGGTLTVTSDLRGSDSSIEFIDATASWVQMTGLDGIGISAGSNVANMDSVTFAEIKLILETEVSNGVPGDLIEVLQNGAGAVSIFVSTGTTGAGSEIELTANTSAEAIEAFGFPAAPYTTNGVDAAKVEAFLISSGYRGVKSPGLGGNMLSVEIAQDPKAPSRGAGEDLVLDATSGTDTIYLKSLTGIQAETVLKISEGPISEFNIVDSVESVATPTGIQHVAKLRAPLTNPFTAAGATVESSEHTLYVRDKGQLVETFPRLSVNPGSRDYIEAKVNDPKLGSKFVTIEALSAGFPDTPLETRAPTQLMGGTSEVLEFTAADIFGSDSTRVGRFAFDGEEINTIACPPSYSGDTIPASPAVLAAISDYAKMRKDCFPILDVPGGLTPKEVKVFREDELGLDTEWGALYYPYVTTEDPFSASENAVIEVPPSGHIAGLYARVDDLEDGGVQTAPAGEGAFGEVRGIKGLAFYVGDKEQELLNPAGINCIRKFKNTGSGSGIVVYGARNLSTNPDLRYIQNRRYMTYAQQSTLQIVRKFVFRDNDPALWGKVRDKLEKFFRAEHSERRLAGRTTEEAFYIEVGAPITTNADIDNGIFRGRIYLALKKPAEFISFEFGRLPSGETFVTEL